MEKNTATMTKKEREIVFNKFGGKCAYCGCELTKSFHVDHYEPINRVLKHSKERGLFTDSECLYPERNTIENYMPSCASCNRMKSDNSLDGFRAVIGKFINSLNNYHVQYKFAKKYGLVEETNNPVVFHFEKQQP